MKVLHITGYKSLELGIFKEDDPKVSIIKYAIKKRIIGFIEEGLEWVIVSGQMGVELWTAEIVLDLKEEYEINLAVFPPFENQDKRWPDNLKEKYQEITMTADFFKPLYQGDYKAPYQFQAKNMWLVDKSDASLLLIDEEYPGSVKFFYDVAKKEEAYPVYLITPLDLDDIVEELRMQDPDYWSS
ncbi:SLOG family protein [Oceanobacillus sp. CAU 1775]